MSKVNKPQIPNCAMAFFAVLAMSFLLCSRSGELLDVSSGSMAMIFLSRFSEVLTFIVVAIMFRHRLPNTATLLSIAIALMMAYLTISLLLTLSSSTTAEEVFDLTATFLYGIASALYRLYLFSVLVRYQPRISALLFCASFLVGNFLLWIMAAIPNEMLFGIRAYLVVASTACLIVVAFVQAAFGKPQSHAAEKDLSAQKTVFPSTKTDWALLLVAAAIFHNLFGVIAQASSSDGAYFALYDPDTSLILIVINAALFVFLWFYGARFDFGIAIGIITALYATGFAFYSFAWAAGNPIAGALIRGGFLCSTVLMWTFMARKSYVDPGKSYFYFALFLAVTSLYPGRLLSTFLLSSNGSQVGLLHALSLGALWLICFFGLFAFFAAFRGGKKRAEEEASPKPSAANVMDTEPDSCGEENGEDRMSEPADAQDALASFTRKVEGFASQYALSTRERDVLIEMLHGCSRAAIAKKMNLSPETIKTYTARIYGKARVSSKQELIELVEQQTI